MMADLIEILEVNYDEEEEALPLPPPIPLSREREEFVYSTKTLSKQQLFDAAFLHAGEMMLEFTDDPFRIVPYWFGLAGEESVDEAVQRWELAHQSIPGPAQEITGELRTLWAKVSMYIIEIHSMAFRCWLKRKMVEDIMENKYDFLTGKGWLDSTAAIYFTKAENKRREKQILEFCSNGPFGVYFKALEEIYDTNMRRAKG